MKKENCINAVLFEYVKNSETWFYWYHNPNRLKALYNADHNVNPNPVKEYIKDDCEFIKKIWRFKPEYLDLDPYTKNDKITIEKNLYEFFNAVLDEVRIKKANTFARYALYISDNEDLAYFRDTVTRREISADIDYNKQRDHAVHTLYNYILGWYIFEYSGDLLHAFKTYFEKSHIIEPNSTLEYLDFYKKERFCTIEENEFKNLIVLVNEFADVWQIASLLHDIGYILEGSISSADPEVEHARIINGSSIIHDYFNHFFWKMYEIDFRAAKNIAKKFGIVIPDFKRAESLSSLGDHLCDIGSCENIRKNILNIDKNRYENSNYKSLKDHGFNREAISIWKEYYELYGNQKMQDILCIVEKVYKHNIWIGSDHDKRNLDHGVCSGLIVLQALTFSHELFLAFSNSDAVTDPNRKFEYKDLFKKDIFKYKNLFKKDISPENSINFVSASRFKSIGKEIISSPKRIVIRGDVPVDIWFKKLLWATASTAIHSIIQTPEYRNKCKEHIHKAALETDKYKDHPYLRIGLDDPLAFLGVLVDVLQEWDRYTVTKQRGETAFTGVEPLQGIDVEFNLFYRDSSHLTLPPTLAVFNNMNKIHLAYPNDGEKSAKKQTDKLNECLEDWTNIIHITGYDRNNSS